MESCTLLRGIATAACVRAGEAPGIVVGDGEDRDAAALGPLGRDSHLCSHDKGSDDAHRLTAELSSDTRAASAVCGAKRVAGNRTSSRG